MLRNYFLTFSILMAALFSAAPLSATSYTWNGGSGNWNNPSNWTPAGVPGPNDAATISDGTVIISSATEVQDLILNGGEVYGQASNVYPLTVTGTLDWVGNAILGYINLTLASGGLCNIQSAPMYTEGAVLGGTFTVNGTLNLQAGYLQTDPNGLIVNGTMNWVYGNIYPDLTVNSGATLNFIGSDYYRVIDDTLRNYGTLNWNDGNLHVAIGWFLNDGIINVNAANSVVEGGFPAIGQEFFENYGTINLGATVENFITNIHFTNAGTVNFASASTLNIANGMNSSASYAGPAGSKIKHTGSAICNYTAGEIGVTEFTIENSYAHVYLESATDVSSFENVILDGGFLLANTNLPGAANYTLTQWGHLALNTDLSASGNLSLGNSQLQGTGTLTVLESATCTWNGCILGLDFVIEENAVVNLGALGQAAGQLGSFGGIHHLTGAVNGTFLNKGTLNWLSPGYLFSFETAVTNKGVINILADTISVILNGPNQGTNTAFENLSGASVSLSPGTQYVYWGMRTRNHGSITALGTCDLYFSSLEQDGVLSVAGGDLYAGFEFVHFTNNSQTTGFQKITLSCYQNGGIAANAQFSTPEIFHFQGVMDFAIDKVLPASPQYWFDWGEVHLNTPLATSDSVLAQFCNFDGTGSLSIGQNMHWIAGDFEIPVSIGDDAVVVAEDSFFIQNRIFAPFVNNGELIWRGDSMLIDNVAFDNNGTFSIDAPNNVALIGTGSFLNDGLLSNCSLAPVTAVFNLPVTNNGSINGSGSYDFAGGLTNNGTVNPGCSPGTLTILGDFNAGQAINIEVTGTAAGQFDKLIVNGNMTAGGTLNVIAPAGMSMTSGLPIIESSGSMTGTFANVNVPAGLTLIVQNNMAMLMPNSPFMVTPDNLVVPATAGTNANFQVISTQSGTWTVRDDAAWLTQSIASSTGNKTVNVANAVNNSAINSRTAEISVKKGTTTRIVTVTQRSANGQVCFRPTSLTTTLNGFSATASWDAMPGASVYQFSFRRVGTSAWTNANVTGTSHLMANLLAGTQYEWRIRTKCSNTSYSAYSKNIRFWTPPPVMAPGQWIADEAQTSTADEIEAFGNEALVSVFPNPVSERFFVNWDNLAADLHSVVLTDVLGRAVKRFEIGAENALSGSLEIETSQFEKGVLMVQLLDATGGQLGVERVVLQ